MKVLETLLINLLQKKQYFMFNIYKFVGKGKYDKKKLIFDNKLEIKGIGEKI